jgi:hypothetical protein
MATSLSSRSAVVPAIHRDTSGSAGTAASARACRERKTLGMRSNVNMLWGILHSSTKDTKALIDVSHF